MSDSEQPQAQNWNAFVEQWNEQFLDALEDNMEAQAQFVESWSETVGEMSDEEEISDGVEGYAKAYETWMGASKQMVDRMNDQLEGEDVELEEFRDVWLNTANEAFKDVMSTTAFARMTGETVGDVLELQQQADEASKRRSERSASRPNPAFSKSATDSSNSSDANTPSSENSTASSST